MKLKALMVVVVAHWIEHLTQAWQVWYLGWPRHHAGGALGLLFPWLVHSEWLHWGYAFLMAMVMLAIENPSRWWTVAILLQGWHLFEHTLLLTQAQAGVAEPTSLIQLFFPRIELHLFYNTIVTVPMLVALWQERKQEGL